jgi:alkyl sulfatase BDS1-like metallo-beta-lactamase superfamily hydrolase
LVRSEGANDDEKKLLAKCLRVIAERTPAANIRNWCITRARHLDGSFPMDRFTVHNFNPKFLAESAATGIVHTLRVLVDPDKIDGMNHHIAFTVGDETCGLHVRNAVAVPTDGWGAQSLVTMPRDTFMGVVSGRRLWSEAVAAGEIKVSGDAAAVDQFRLSLDNKGFAG